MKKKKVKKLDIKIIADYIEQKFDGWKLFVIGPSRIQKQIGSKDLCYEFVVEFVGKKHEMPKVPVKNNRRNRQPTEQSKDVNASKT